ncbi:MAG: DNA-binding protein [Gemmataceae bacterium]|nr:DNA-binding protein [Gemmataceae bacterium]
MPNNIAQTPPAVARRLGVNVHKILGWIRTGELRAVNLGDGTRPRWRIMSDDLQAFLEGRAAQPATPVRRAKRKKLEGVTEYF